MAIRYKAVAQNLLVFIGAVIFAVVLAELALRLVLPSPIIWKYPQESYIYDPEIGHWLEPGQTAYTHDKIVRINSEGLRDAEYSSDSLPDVYRILALGDSQTFGNGLELADTWPKQLETMLERRADGHRFEVINSGLPGSDTWQHEIILNRMVEIYRPDAVLLAFYVNDVVKKFVPAQMQHEKNELLTRVSYLLKRSALLLMLRKAMGILRQSSSPSKGFLEQQALVRGEDSPVLEQRWQQVDESLSAMKKASAKHEVSFGILLLPRRDQVDGRLPWDAYANRIGGIASQYSIPVISMQEPLQEAYETHGKNLFIPWDGHNSSIANKVIAQEAADRIFVIEHEIRMNEKISSTSSMLDDQ